MEKNTLKRLWNSTRLMVKKTCWVITDFWMLLAYSMMAKRRYDDVEEEDSISDDLLNQHYDELENRLRECKKMWAFSIMNGSSNPWRCGGIFGGMRAWRIEKPSRLPSTRLPIESGGNFLPLHDGICRAQKYPILSTSCFRNTMTLIPLIFMDPCFCDKWLLQNTIHPNF